MTRRTLVELIGVLVVIAAFAAGMAALGRISAGGAIVDSYAAGRMNGECRFMQMEIAKPKGGAPSYIGVPFVKANATCDSLYSPAPR